jgi:hypothetical protein
METLWKDKTDGGHSVNDGQEVQTIRRETVNKFADWQEREEINTELNTESIERYGSPFYRLPESHKIRVRSQVARKEAEIDAIGTPETNDPQHSGPMVQRDKEVLQSFCILSRMVMDKVFRYRQAADCICPDRARHPLANFEFSDAVLAYIKRAVIRSIIEDGKL